MIEIFLLLFVIAKSSGINPNNHNNYQIKQIESEQIKPNLCFSSNYDYKTLDSLRSVLTSILMEVDELYSLLDAANTEDRKSELKSLIKIELKKFKQAYQNGQGCGENLINKYLEIRKEYIAKSKETVFVGDIIYQLKMRIHAVYNVLNWRIRSFQDEFLIAVKKSLGGNWETIVVSDRDDYKNNVELPDD